jgi:preprotein translocase subunit SecY
MTGVMPIIFASSIVSLVPTILALCGVTNSTKGFWGWVSRILASDGWVYPVSLFLLIIAFAYFYTTITFDPVEVSNRIKSQGGTIAGIRQGRPTSDFIKSVLNKVTLVGALFLGIIAILPIVAGPHLIQHVLQWFMDGSDLAIWAKENATGSNAWLAQYYSSQITSTVQSMTSTFTFGGTTLLILVGVVLETFRELEAQLTMRNYKGFL